MRELERQKYERERQIDRSFIFSMCHSLVGRTTQRRFAVRPTPSLIKLLA